MVWTRGRILSIRELNSSKLRCTVMDMPIQIRVAQATDQKVIRQIVRRARVNPLGIKWPNFLLAEMDGQIIGIGQVKVHGDGSREVASIAVLPGYRRQGIASAIIEALLAREKGILYLMCRGEMESFYQPFGFVRATGPALPRDLARIDKLNGALSKVLSLFTDRPIYGIIMRREPKEPIY